MTVYDKVKGLCEENQITIGALEKKLGLSNGIVSKWVTATPRLSYIGRVADYFGVPVDYFWEGDENVHQ